MLVQLNKKNKKKTVMVEFLERGPGGYLEDTDRHGHPGYRDEVPLNPLLACPETASLVDNVSVVFSLEVS